MAKSGNGRLSKLKCMIKRWHSSSRLTRTAPSSTGAGAGSSSRMSEEGAWHSASFHVDEVPPGLHPVYVGKSRRRYLVSAELVGHPIFRVLVERSGGGREDDGDGEGGTVVGCEVVLFEHLLWMLENADPQPESLDELVEFYAC